MADDKNILYAEWTYEEALPKPFQEDKGWKKGRRYWSQFHLENEDRVRLHSASLQAVLAYARLQLDQGTGESLGKGAVGLTKDGWVLAELPFQYGMDTAAYSQATGEFEAVRHMAEWDMAPYTLEPHLGDGAVLFLAAMPLFAQEEEFRHWLEILKREMARDYANKEEALTAALILCDNMYSRVTCWEECGDDGVYLDCPKDKPVQTLWREFLPEDISPLAGTFTTLGPRKRIDLFAIGKSRGTRAGSLTEKYRLSDRQLSPQEQQMVPEIPEWYISQKEVEDICCHAVSNPKIRNFLLRGPSGVGKSEAARTVAAALHLPYVSFSCCFSAETRDLLGTYVPVQEEKQAEEEVQDEEELRKMHAPTVYFQLTGIYDEKKTVEDVLRKRAQLAALAESTREPRLVFQESTLVQAVRYGWVVEVQDAEYMNPAVLAGLNSLLGMNRTVQLPTGETLRRHPDCVILFTAGKNSIGNRRMDDRIVSRMDMVLEMHDLGQEDMAERAIRVTGFKDKTLVRKMASVVRDIARYCAKNLITDGCCGTRELILWVKSTRVTGDPYRSAMYTVIPHATQDPDAMQELITTCLERKFVSRETEDLVDSWCGDDAANF